MFIVEVQKLQLSLDELRGIFRFHEEDNVGIKLLLDIPQPLNCYGIPKPTTVPAQYF